MIDCANFEIQCETADLAAVSSKSIVAIDQNIKMATSKAKASTADRFASLFDQDWANSRSLIRNRVQESRVYDPTNSWEARSDNPRSFSRLDQTLVPFQKTSPIVLSGTQVIRLENNVGFNAINVKQPVQEKSSIPLNLNQQDATMQSGLSGKVPLIDQVDGERTILVMKGKPSFGNQALHGPQLEAIAKPEFMIQAGDQANQRLLNPKQRREFNIISQQELDAKNLVHRAKLQRRHTRNIVSGPDYTRGVLMVDSNDNIHSEIYGERAIQAQADKEYKRQVHLERRSRLANMESSMQTNGNLLNPETLGPRVKIEKVYQSKGGEYHALSFDETHNRLFCRLQGAASSNRTQLLRDTELSGKDYNVTQHTIIEHWPARQFERQSAKVMDHPSQQALEGPRNLQGTIRPV